MLTNTEQENLEQYIQGIDVSRIAIAFDALGDSYRCLIFRALLKAQDVTVGQLARVVGISVSLASQHLKVLLQAGLVDKTKSGTRVYYQVNKQDDTVKAITKAVEVKND
ncbi:MAG: metalloregulator ArsR/SmtB family transcription factor [bacterium]|nr:metalloregulator ArsR/SmtB family transcription factor [bacterium]